MSNLYRGPSTDPSFQVSVRLAKWSQRRRFFRNRPIRNKNCLWWPCLLTDQDEMSNLNRETSIDTSYQVSVPLAKRFQRRRFFRVSEWLMFNANSAIFQLNHDENNLIFIEMMMKSALFQTNTLSWIFIVLAHWNKNLLHLHLFWFRANQSLLFLLNAACLAEKQQIPVL
jgi:hypothetical protein